MSDGSPHRWESVNALGAEADVFDLLTAARDDLVRQRTEIVADGRETALGFEAPRIEAHDGGHELVVRVESLTGRWVPVHLSQEVVRAAATRHSARHDTTPLHLLAYGTLARAEPLGRGWRPRRVGRARPLPDSTKDYYRRLYRTTPASEAVEGHLRAGRDVVVVGDHGAGKSALVFVAAERRERDGDTVIWLNLADPADGPESVVSTLLAEEASDSGRYLLVVENLHANLPVFRPMFDCVSRLRADFGLPVQVLATSWRATTEVVGLQDPARRLEFVPAEGRDLVTQMLADETDIDLPAQQEILGLAEDDAHVARTAIDLYHERGRRVPDESDLEEHYTREVDTPEQRRVLYTLACLGVLELQLPTGRDDPLQPVLLELKKKDLIYQVDGAYLVGPRRRAQLVMGHACRHWLPGTPWQSPEQVVWQHLQQGGERLMKATLSRLDQLVSPDQARAKNLYLLSTWDMLGRLGKALCRRTEEDPGWGDNLGAAVFAGTALARLQHPAHWRTIAAGVRSRWPCDRDDADLPEPAADRSADYQDFVEIQESMAQEDAQLGEVPHLAGLKAGALNKDRMYRSWVLGLLLGFEGTAPPEQRDQQRIERLVRLAERAQSDEGWFYPARVPWVTARVVLGLTEVGLRKDHPVVREACNWLLRPVEQGGPLQNWWRSGTGSWNRAEATTAMCLSALIRSGIRPERAEAAHAWLMGRYEEWTLPEREIDLAQVLEATLLITRSASGTREHLETLFDRMNAELRNDGSTDTRIPEARLRLPFVAAQLADTVWRIVQLESRKLYGDVLNQNRYELPAGPADPPVTVTPEPLPAPAGLTPHQESEWQQAADEFRLSIREQIAKRDRGVITPATTKALEELKADRARFHQLMREFDRRAPRRLLTEIDDLGRRVCGATWPELPYPDDPGNGDA